MYGINENTRLLFLKTINDMDKQLQYYAKKKESNSEYIERKNRQIQELYNFYNEVENAMTNFKFTGDVFNISNTADYKELQRLKVENRNLRSQLAGLHKNKHFNNSSEREAFRYLHNAEQREYFKY